MEKATKEELLKLTTHVQNVSPAKADIVFRIAKKRLLDIAATVKPEQSQEMELLNFALESPDLDILAERLNAMTVAQSETEPRLFVDMDGTLAEFKPVDTLEKLYEEGYFLNLNPLENVVNSIKEMMRLYPEKEVYIMSAVLSDSPFAIKEKNEWLDRYLPEIDQNHRIFTPCGEDKLSYVPGGAKETDYLLDDYTKNLIGWEPPARGIKLLNGINHTNGTWKGCTLRFDKQSVKLARHIVAVMEGAVIKDAVPQQDQEQKSPKF